MLKRITVLSLLFVSSLVFAEYKSPYDAMFKNLNASSSNIIFQSLDSMDINLVYSALKRVGELRYRPAASKVREWISESNPAANVGKAGQRTALRNIFHISIWALGRVGNDEDAKTLASYWRDLRDKESQLALIQALGEIKGSKIAIDKLNELTKFVTDERLGNALLDSIEKQNSPTSVFPLMVLQRQASFSPAFKKRARALMTKLSHVKGK